MWIWDIWLIEQDSCRSSCRSWYSFFCSSRLRRPVSIATWSSSSWNRREMPFSHTVSASSCPHLHVHIFMFTALDWLLYFYNEEIDIDYRLPSSVSNEGFRGSKPIFSPPSPQSHLRVMLAFVRGAYRIPTSYSEVPSSMYWACLDNGRL